MATFFAALAGVVIEKHTAVEAELEVESGEGGGARKARRPQRSPGAAEAVEGGRTCCGWREEAKEEDLDPSRPGTVADSYQEMLLPYNFSILHNLLEMNGLWIRIQHMPGEQTKEVRRFRKRERNE